MKSYTFSEYRKMKEMSNLDRVIGHLQKNKKEYAKLVFLLAVFMPKQCFAANSWGVSDDVYEIIQLGMDFAKIGCIGKGIMNMTNEMLEGANLKEAMSEGASFFIFYIILKFYPVIFNMIK